MVGGGLAGLGYSLLRAQRLETSLAVGAAVYFILVGALIGLVVALDVTERRVFRLRRQVPIAEDDLYRYARAWFGHGPWHFLRDEGGELVFRRRTEPSTSIFIFLLVLGVLPGIVYSLLMHGTQTVHIVARPISGGSDLEIAVQPRREDGRRRVTRFYNSLQNLLPD